jgi:hypothetical protein
MDKTSFEKFLSNRSENIYQDKKREFSTLICKFLDTNSFMNAHEKGNSLKMDMDMLTNKMFETRKSEIINQIQKYETNKILGELNNLKYLFDEMR